MKHTIIHLNYKYCIKCNEYLYQTKLRNYSVKRLSYTLDNTKILYTHPIDLSIHDMIREISMGCDIVRIGDSNIKSDVLLSFLHRVVREGVSYIKQAIELKDNMITFVFDKDIINLVNVNRSLK